ncbi:hypothetical protein GCM10010978_29030 [Compostibacillus humi]|uniref:NERD domain-containing protein n=1 Tax=Compostibacillus humi TaxID=1245525 RepID=A0A8J2TSU2_9BACI|nr:NERD domain-containing protein [Compostibacillus humi]GFZ87394.1 hypothetical protein GCM10010978_29030 [Compostibacillus humi]
MAQLIKLADYLSRYEWDTYRYPAQFIRMKKDNWNKLYQQWQEEKFAEPEDVFTKEETESQPKSPLEKLKLFAKKERKLESVPKEEKQVLPNNIDELKQYYLDRLLQFQLKWGTSTMTQMSKVDAKYFNDMLLKFFLQRFPDNYLLMYYPVFYVKHVPIDGEIVFISPIGMEIIHVLELEDNAVIMAGDERTWNIEKEGIKEKIISPVVSLKRTENIIKSILHNHHVEFPIQKTILSRTNSIFYYTEPYNTTIIGKDEYGQWFKERRSLHSPLKSRQLKTASVLLKHCQTNSIKRPEWEDSDEFIKIGDVEDQ